jgi:hypothetical protein
MHAILSTVLLGSLLGGVPPMLRQPAAPAPAEPTETDASTPEAQAPAVDARDLAADALVDTSIRYELRAQLTAETRTIQGTERITWKNPADVALDEIPLHLYLNAFSNEASSWARGQQELRGWDVETLLKAFPDPWGSVTVSNVIRKTTDAAGVVTSTPCTMRFVQPDDGNPLDRTLAVIELGTPLLPGETLELSLEFTSRLPIPIARTGGHSDYFHVAQWFPKVAVYEVPGERGNPTGGFVGRQFHGPTEFYADFADYDVTIDAPRDFIVVATGTPEKAQGETPTHERVRFVQKAVHDFAFVVAKGIHVETHEKTPKGGGPKVAISYVVPKGFEHTVPKMRKAAETTFDVLGERIGPYPYTTMKIVAPPWKALATSGMEYPTLVTGAPLDPMFEREFLSDVREDEATIAHEVTHNYFYGLVANNEQDEAYLDEGFTQYWEMEIMRVIADGGPLYGTLLDHPVDAVAMARRGMRNKSDKIVEPVVRQPSYLFLSGTHGSQIYSRTMLIFRTAAQLFGQGAVDRIFSTWFMRKRFHHPSTAELFALIDEVSSPELAAFLREAYTTGPLPDYRVDDASTEEWKPPLGHFTTASGSLIVTDENGGSDEVQSTTLDPLAREENGEVWMHIVDPGFIEGLDITNGGEERRLVAPARVTARADFKTEDKVFHRSSVRVRGPEWKTIPVDVRFTFADGVVVTDRFDGRAPWREYRFVRAAPLDSVVIDPDDTILIDPDPGNNARALHVDEKRSRLVGLLLGAIATFVAMGVSLWL